MKAPDQFGSRLGMMLVMLGMAVGTGNIWRFPRIAAQNGGGEFLVAWICFLFLWSIPLILLEFGMGRKARSGPVKAFMLMMGPRWAWMGAFVAFAATAIMFYYSVVAGWTVRYVVAAASGEIPRADPGGFWLRYTTSWWPVVTHGAVMALATIVVARGIGMIERVARVLMPSLLVLVVILTMRAVTLPDAMDGLRFLYGVDWTALGRAELWIQALTQNAWDTGAGWGLVLCYAAYLREREDTALNAFILPMANNTISLLAGMMVLCTVFSLTPRLVESFETDPEVLGAYPGLQESVAGGEPLTAELIESTIFTSSNEGLTFIWMPQLFDTLPFGQFFMTLFFLALAFAAFTSLMAMLELATRVLTDFQLPRGKAVLLAGSAGFLLGLPSAVFMPFFKNQDWVWSVGLMVSGLFFAVAVIVNGVQRFREEQINHADSDIRVGRWWDVVVGVMVPLQAVVLLVWWLYQSSQWDPAGWYLPFRAETVGTVLFQFGVLLGVLLLANRWMARRAGGGG